MSKSFRHYKNKNSKRKIRKQTRKKKMKAGNGEKVRCSICEKNVDIVKTFIPRECLMKHGKAAHRVCDKCWWDPQTGFALESSSHLCPGCQKGLPLTPYKKEPHIVVDLTEE